VDNKLAVKSCATDKICNYRLIFMTPNYVTITFTKCVTFERILPVVYLGNLISKNVKNRNKNIYIYALYYNVCSSVFVLTHQ
jgi:hypothetical protein